MADVFTDRLGGTRASISRGVFKAANPLVVQMLEMKIDHTLERLVPSRM